MIKTYGYFGLTIGTLIAILYACGDIGTPKPGKAKIEVREGIVVESASRQREVVTIFVCVDGNPAECVALLRGNDGKNGRDGVNGDDDGPNCNPEHGNCNHDK